MTRFLIALVVGAGWWVASGPRTAHAVWPLVLPEQRHVEVRDPASLPRAPVPLIPPPPTVASTAPRGEPWRLGLDEAIQVALRNSRVVRVLAGVGASSSGRTIYDPAITNTGIDEQRAAFDPRVNIGDSFPRTETPQAVLDPMSPTGTTITGVRSDGHQLGVTATQRTLTGAQAQVQVSAQGARLNPGLFPLNPSNRSSVSLGVTQPLLRGAGVAVNRVPIVLARIDTERSYFQLKDSVQELVRGVIEGYWGLVFARTDRWARQQQVDLATYFAERAEARFRAELTDVSEPAQARTALASFRTSLLAAQNNVLLREAALLNLLGLPPDASLPIEPTTPPSAGRAPFVWDELLRLAEQQRPDIIELKLILEADEQQLLLADNQVRPQLDAVALYRWNGIEGKTPTAAIVQSNPGQFTDWTLGVNFAVPLGLRLERAQLRRRELLLERDRANLEQAVHATAHLLANNVRTVDLDYAQYELFREARAAAVQNLDRQLADFRAERSNVFLNVRQAITDWGNILSSEAQALSQYNVDLATLERQTGTILETHGVRFFEERYGSIGPITRRHAYPCYPRDVRPTGNAPVYPAGDRPAEQFFELKAPKYRSE